MKKNEPSFCSEILGARNKGKGRMRTCYVDRLNHEPTGRGTLAEKGWGLTEG